MRFVLAVMVGLMSTAVCAAQCKAVCEAYYDRCHKTCASGDKCATECEDDQQVCLVSCRRNHGDRAAIDQSLAARRRQREKARAKNP